MRRYSKIEKTFIGKIIESSKNYQSNILKLITETISNDRAILLESDKISLLFFEGDNDFIEEFFELISLIEFLRNERFIFVHSKNNEISPNGFISENLTKEKIERSQICLFDIPTDLISLINFYNFSYIIPSTELKNIYRNNFIHFEQIYHERELKEAKKQTKIAYFSFVIALIALIISFVFPLLKP